MATATTANPRLEKLRKEAEQLQAKIRDLEAREKQQSRKDDTRRKIIAGALALEHMEKNPKSDFAGKMTGLLNDYVKDNERRLFADLPGIKPPTFQPDGKGFPVFNKHRSG